MADDEEWRSRYWALSKHVRKEHSHLIGVACNPGWNSEALPLKEFTDVRELQRQLDVSMILEADESSTGPASFMMADPDGNTILVDQHV